MLSLTVFERVVQRRTRARQVHPHSPPTRRLPLRRFASPSPFRSNNTHKLLLRSSPLVRCPRMSNAILDRLRTRCSTPHPRASSTPSLTADSPPARVSFFFVFFCFFLFFFVFFCFFLFACAFAPLFGVYVKPQSTRLTSFGVVTRLLTPGPTSPLGTFSLILRSRFKTSRSRRSLQRKRHHG